MAKKRKSKKKGILRSRFYQIYILLVALCIAGIIFGMQYLNTLLADYESAQPKYVAREAVQLFENGDYSSIYDLDTSMQGVTDVDKGLYVKTLTETADGKTITWSESYSPSEDEKRYKVLLDDERFAEFSLIPSGQTTERGNRLWSLGTITTYVTVATPEPTAAPTPEPSIEEPKVELITCTITVPSDFKVIVDGKTLDANNVVEADIPTASAGMLPENVPSPTLIRYAFLSETNTPEITVTNTAGEAQTVNQNSETDWSVDLPQSPELKELYEEAVIRVAKQISSHSAKDASQASVLQYCAKNSPARESIKSFDNTWGTRHNGATFENVVTSDYYMYSDSCFSCHVSFDYVATFGKSTVKTYPTSYTLYFIREGNSGKLYSFTLY